MMHAQFEVDRMKTVGGVGFHTRHGNGKNDQKTAFFYIFKAKWRTSCWTSGIAPRDFFVCLEHLHMSTEFRSPTINW